MLLLDDFSLTLSSYLDLDEVLEAVYARIQDIWDPPGFFIAVYRRADDALDFPIYVEGGERLEPFRRALTEESSLAAWVARNREPLLIRDWDEESDTSPVPGMPLGDLPRSWLGVPLLVADRLVGVMAVQHHESNAYGAEHERLLSTIASGVALIIENIRLYQQSEQYAQELAARTERLALVNRISMAVSSTVDLDEILLTATREMANALHVTHAGTILFDHNAGVGHLVAEYQESPTTPRQDVRIPLSDNLSLERVIATQQALVISDVSSNPLVSDIRDTLLGRDVQSVLIVPLVVQGNVTGTISLEVLGSQCIFTAEEIDMAQTIANQVSLAVENVRLHQETQQRLKEVTLLFDTSAAVSRSLDGDRVLQTTAKQITSALDADGCTISIWDRELDALVTRLVYSPDPGRSQPKVEGTVYALADYPASRQVLAKRQPLAFQADAPEVEPVAVAWMNTERIQSLLMVPLVVRDEAIGLLELMQADFAREFTPTEIALCQTLANQAASALENANLYAGVKRADEAKSEFIDFVAHELKQPMTAMQGYAKMLTMGIGGELTDTQTQFVEVIKANVDRMGKLVNDLLEISRLEAGRTKLRMAPVQLGEVVQEAITNTRTEIEARHHTLEIDIPQALPPVLGDRDRLVQILTNLVSNAYKYTPEGGTIRIIVDRRSHPEVPANHLCVQVSDTGIGMTSQEVTHLEEKFFRGSHPLVQEQPGTGLGVSITRNLVALHRGEFLLESEPGQGSTFCFSVPIAELAAAPNAGLV
jgi:signal transduction histidine kinase